MKNVMLLITKISKGGCIEKEVRYFKANDDFECIKIKGDTTEECQKDILFDTFSYNYDYSYKYSIELIINNKYISTTNIYKESYKMITEVIDYPKEIILCRKELDLDIRKK